MATGRRRFAAGQLRTLYQLGAIGDLSDRQLLERFTAGEAELAELAFAALVERHGPMVLRVCSALLRNPHDAQDAFQATFVVLLRKARELWIHDSLGPWLHRVAKRLAVQIQASARRRRTFERRGAESRSALISEACEQDGRWTVLHEEIDRLPERYRVPVIFCHLEGQSHELAAKILKLPVGTVKSRLHRARDILRGRLLRRGVAFTAGMLTAEMASRAADAQLSLPLFTSLFRAAARSSMTRAGESGLISQRTVHLVEEAIKTMFLTRIRTGVAVALLAACLAAGAAGVFAQQGPGQETGREPKPSSSDTARAGAASRELAPPYVRQSRKMIVERLEQELVVARERLDRTARKVRASSDPELVRARKTADTLAGLMARIDTVLVEAVDQFPTMFDFSNAEANGETGPAVTNSTRTDRIGKPDIDLVVSESKRILDVGEITTFQIRVRNHGTKDATDLMLNATLSDNLEVQDTNGGTGDVRVAIHPQNHTVVIQQVNKFGPGKEMVFGIRVKVVGETPKLATCKVFITHDGLSDWFEDMAGVKVTAGRRTGAAPPAGTDGARTDPAADDSAKTTTAPPPQKAEGASAGPAYDEHSLAKAAEKLEWSRKMHEKGYVSKGQYEQDLATHEALKARIDADLARAAERVDWAKKMFEKGYVSKSQYQAEILKHYDALQARLEGQSQAVSDDLMKRYELLKSKLQEHRLIDSRRLLRQRETADPAKPKRETKEGTPSAKPRADSPQPF